MNTSTINQFLKKYVGIWMPITAFLTLVAHSLNGRMPESFLRNMFVWESFVYQLSIKLLLSLITVFVLFATVQGLSKLVSTEQEVFSKALATDWLVVFLISIAFILVRAFSFLLIEKISESYLDSQSIWNYLDWILLYVFVKLAPFLVSLAPFLMEHKREAE